MYGLVLEGGGAKGSYHIGAYKAILEEGIDIQGVAGTSIGALNGAMIVQGDYDVCYQLWDEISYSMIVGEEGNIFTDFAEAELSLEDFKKLSKKTLNLIRGRGFSVDQFRFMLDKYIDEDRIRASHKDFGIVTFNLSDFKPVEITIDEIPHGELKDYLMASAYLPIFKFERLGGKLYLDGGIYDNLPFRILQKKGYEELILVRTHGRGIIRKLNGDQINTVTISPSDDLGHSFTFEAETARRNINLGYYDGLRALRGLAGERYYIEADFPRDFGFKYLLSLDEKIREDINSLLGFKYGDSRRVLFEYSIPKLGSILGLEKDFSYDELIISLLEKLGENREVDRFKLYSYQELKNEVRIKKRPKQKEENIDHGILGKIMEKVDISSAFNKDNLIINVAENFFKEINEG